MDVNYNFRINLADYKRVIGVADTNVSGSVYPRRVARSDVRPLPGASAPEGDEPA